MLVVEDKAAHFLVMKCIQAGTKTTCRWPMRHPLFPHSGKTHCLSAFIKDSVQIKIRSSCTTTHPYPDIMIQSGGLSQLPEPELSFQDCEKFLLLQDPPRSLCWSNVSGGDDPDSWSVGGRIRVIVNKCKSAGQRHRASHARRSPDTLGRGWRS